MHLFICYQVVWHVRVYVLAIPMDVVECGHHFTLWSAFVGISLIVKPFSGLVELPAFSFQGVCRVLARTGLNAARSLTVAQPGSAGRQASCRPGECPSGLGLKKISDGKSFIVTDLSSSVEPWKSSNLNLLNQGSGIRGHKAADRLISCVERAPRHTPSWCTFFFRVLRSHLCSCSEILQCFSFFWSTGKSHSNLLSWGTSCYSHVMEIRPVCFVEVQCQTCGTACTTWAWLMHDQAETTLRCPVWLGVSEIEGRWQISCLWPWTH